MTIPELYGIYKSTSGVSTDTRSIVPGSIFFALKGENFDANLFAGKAIEAGAEYVVIDDPAHQTDKAILVTDTLKTLQELAHYHREQLSIPVIGLTGSNGKTTTKELMAAVLSKKYRTAFTKGNLNNHIGVPLTLLAILETDEIAIVEMGANHQKEIEFLCSLCDPGYGYITNFGKAHLEGFGGIEGVIKGKSELYDHLRKKNRKIFLNADDPQQVSQSKGLQKISFGESEDVKYRITLLEKEGSETVIIGFNGLQAQTKLTGKYNFSNIGAAIAVGLHFEVDSEDIKNALETYLPENNRSQVSQTERNKLVIDTYNANPSSTEAALHNFAAFPAMDKWVLLGDMFELGEYSESEHQHIGEIASSKTFEKIVLVGKEYSRCRFDTNDNILQLATTDDLLKFLQDEKPSGKTILLKGSRGMKLERAIPYL